MRFGGEWQGGAPLVWTAWFGNDSDNSAAYPMETLLGMKSSELTALFSAFTAAVILTHYGNAHFDSTKAYDHRLLKALGLPPDAGLPQIHARYRQMAKLLHPDAGGDHESFVRLRAMHDELLKQTI